MSKKTKNSKTELESLRLPELQARYREVVGETTQSPNRKFLMRRIEETLASHPSEPNASDSQPEVTAEIATDEVTTEQPQEPDAIPVEPVEPSVEAETTEAADEPSAEQTATEPADAAHSERPETETTLQETPTEHTPDAEQGTTSPEASETQATEATPDAAPLTEAPEEKKPRGRFAAMTIADLQALYMDKVGRPSGSTHRGYLIWKIREAEKGRITVGPIQPRTHTGEPKEMKVLPLSLEATAVEKMDAAWRAKGIKSRMEFLRQAIGSHLTQLGDSEAAALFAAE